MPAREAGKTAGGESSGDGAILLVRPRPHHLVQRAQREPAAGKRRVDRRQTERQHACRGSAAALERMDALAERRKRGGRRSCHASLMFLFCS